ncbi:TPA: TetR family transcriptional regulator, partial [Bacillus anthracis]|nr:TetR family transcriptional regulator [Bacillus anthracis]
PIALIIIVYQPIEKLIKVMETGQLEYTEELVKELEESCWNAIRII